MAQMSAAATLLRAVNVMSRGPLVRELYVSLTSFCERWGLDVGDERCRRAYYLMLQTECRRDLTGADLWAYVMNAAFENERRIGTDNLNFEYHRRMPLCVERIPESVWFPDTLLDQSADNNLEDFSKQLMEALFWSCEIRAHRPDHTHGRDPHGGISVRCSRILNGRRKDYYVVFYPQRNEIAICTHPSRMYIQPPL